ncbi:hypothetical protein MPLB_2410072 [Mesorhizobium sp. ORS 3324]|nr:hypothetical protein MPLB_2410072 [Mesorhizobium sp. ORS 3324]
MTLRDLRAICVPPGSGADVLSKEVNRQRPLQDKPFSGPCRSGVSAEYDHGQFLGSG